MWQQYEIQLKPKNRGFHLVTDEIVSQLTGLQTISVGLMHVFIQHTSASLTINENADPTVRTDFESVFNRLVKENEPYYRHTLEGSDGYTYGAIVGNEYLRLAIPVTLHYQVPVL